MAYKQAATTRVLDWFTGLLWLNYVLWIGLCSGWSLLLFWGMGTFFGLIGNGWFTLGATVAVVTSALVGALLAKLTALWVEWAAQVLSALDALVQKG